jgi:hypothetical protein
MADAADGLIRTARQVSVACQGHHMNRRLR